MARYKTSDAAAGQGLFLTVNLNQQLLCGTFEYMLNDIIDTKIDLSEFQKNYKNDLTGASAVPPSLLLKLIIYSYKRGHLSSREIYELNNTNIIAKALTGDMSIHWTTIASFISSNKGAFEKVFTEVLMYCNELELIGGEMFAVDGLRLPSNASIEMSGTEAELTKRLETYRKMAAKHIEKHERQDEHGSLEGAAQKRFEQQDKEYNRRISSLQNYLETMKRKTGSGGQEIKSNVTDNESAMIYSSKGIIQGYIGIGVADSKTQIIVSAKAFGSASETEHLPQMLDETGKNLQAAGVKELADGKKRLMLGDSHYFSESNFKACEERSIEAVFADKEKNRSCTNGDSRYNTSNFRYNASEDSYQCPHGKQLYREKDVKIGVRTGKRYRAKAKDCRVCPVFSRCIKSKNEQSKLKNGKSLLITPSNEENSLSHKMREKLSKLEYQDAYARRIQIIEPVFANISYCKGLNRFTLRGKEKVNSQWLLYTIVHNLCKSLDAYNKKRKCA